MKDLLVGILFSTSSSPRQEKLRRVVALIFVLAAITVAFMFRDQVSEISEVGYIGIFIIGLVGSATVVLPMPAILAIYVGGATLNPAIVAVVAGLAEALGETTGYLLGFSGVGLVEKHRLYERIRRWMSRRGTVVLCVMAAVPNPLFDVVGLVAGSLRFPLWRFLVSVSIGKMIKNTMVAYAGAWSLPWLHELYQGIF